VHIPTIPKLSIFLHQINAETMKFYDAMCNNFIVGFEVLTADVIKNAAFWIAFAM
jgi:hypothetical protein